MARNLNVRITHQRDHADSLLVIVQRHKHDAVGIAVPGLVRAVNTRQDHIVDRLIHDHIILAGIRLDLVHL